MNAEEDENQFPSEEFEKIMQDTCEQVLKEAMWDEAMVPQWVNEICEDITEQLTKLQKPYKYVVTCLMQQKVGQVSCHSSYSAYWENGTDGCHIIQYPPQQRKDSSTKTVACLVSVFATRF